MEKLIKTFKFKGESVPALRASMPKLVQAVDASCRNHMEIVDNAADGLVEDRNFRLIHYLTFTPWQVYQEFTGLEIEIKRERQYIDDLLKFYQLEGIKTEAEIQKIRQKMLKEWLANPLQQDLAKKRDEFLTARQTIELRAEKLINRDHLEISIFDSTGIMDAMGYESGKYPGTIQLIDASLRDGVMAAIETIKKWLTDPKARVVSGRPLGRTQLTQSQKEIRLQFLELVEGIKSRGINGEQAVARAYQKLDANIDNDKNILKELDQIPAWSTVRGWRKYKT